MNTIYHIHFLVNTIMKSLWPFFQAAWFVTETQLVKASQLQTILFCRAEFPYFGREHLKCCSSSAILICKIYEDSQVIKRPKHFKEVVSSAPCCHLVDRSDFQSSIFKQETETGNLRVFLTFLYCSFVSHSGNPSNLDWKSILWGPITVASFAISFSFERLSFYIYHMYSSFVFRGKKNDVLNIKYIISSQGQVLLRLKSLAGNIKSNLRLD